MSNGGQTPLLLESSAYREINNSHIYDPSETLLCIGGALGQKHVWKSRDGGLIAGFMTGQKDVCVLEYECEEVCICKRAGGRLRVGKTKEIGG